MSTIEGIDSGVGRRPCFDVASTRAIEGAALALLPGFTLMERAGDAVARLALALAPHAREVIVFAGPGNNGGDGVEAATRLAAFGKQVSVVLVGDAARLPADAARAFARAQAAGIVVGSLASQASPDHGAPDLVVDALLGIGASRPPEGDIATAIERIAAFAARGSHVLAVDVPSGLDVDRGQPLGSSCVVADDTLTMIALKPGLITAAGRDHAGRVWLAGLGLADASRAADAWLVGNGDPSCAPVVRRHAEHKGSFGDVAVVGGANGMAGAAWLAARAAHAAGVGRVFVDLVADTDATPTPPDLDPLRPELMFRHGWWHGPVDVLAATTVVCGCGGGDAVRAALPRLLSTVHRLVLDADALNGIAVDSSLQALVAARAGRDWETILTPHPLEAARLLGSSSTDVQRHRLAAARELVDRYRAVVVLKGSGSVIAAPGKTLRINATGNASLASAGTGDVLAGWIGGRWASGSCDAFDVATRGVIEHGAAAEPERPGSLRAGDLVEALHRRARGG